MSGSATWKTVSTLEWKKKQKAPQEAKGFGAILQEAADVVVDKWNAAGNLAPTYLHRLSELQIQDETYIHQQLVKPEEVKPKRGLHRLVSAGKTRSGRGIRVLRPGNSRKVRFTEDPHGKTAAAGMLKAGVAANASNTAACAAPGAAGQGSGFNKGAVAGAGALKPSGIRFVDSNKQTAAASGNSTTAGHADADVSSSGADAVGNAGSRPAGVVAGAGSNSSSGDPTNSSTTPAQGSPAAVQQQEPQQPQPQAAGPRHAGSVLQPQAGCTGASSAGGASSGTSGNGGSRSTSNDGCPGVMLSVYLQQQSAQQLLETPPFTAGSTSTSWASSMSVNWAGTLNGSAGNSSGHWEGALGKTELADKHLQKLRTSTALAIPAAQEQQDPQSPLGYRPLAIPEETFERWSSAAGGGSRQTTRTSVELATTTVPGAAGTGGSTSAAATGSRHSARRVSSTNIPSLQVDETQAGAAQLARRSSRDLPAHLTSSGSAPDLAAMASATAAAGGGVSSGQHSSRSTGESAMSSKQRHTSDYLGSLGSIEASLHSARRTGGSGSPGSGSPLQHPSSPRATRHSNSSITACWSVPGSSSAAAGSGVRAQRSSSSSLPDVTEFDLQRCTSPLKAAAAPGSGGSGRSSRPSSNPRGSRMSPEVHGAAAPTAAGGGASTGTGTAMAHKAGGGAVRFPNIAKPASKTQFPGVWPKKQ